MTQKYISEFKSKVQKLLLDIDDKVLYNDGYFVISILFSLFIMMDILQTEDYIGFIVYLIFCLFVLLFLLLYFLKKWTSVDIEDNKMIDDLMEFIEEQNTKRRKATREILENLEETILFLDKRNNFYDLNKFLTILLASGYFIFIIDDIVLIKVLNFHAVNMPFFLGLHIIGMVFSFYFYIIFFIKKRKLKKVLKAKEIFNKALLKKKKEKNEKIINLTNEKLDKFIFNYEDMLQMITNWHNFYTNNYFDKESVNKLLKQYHEIYYTYEEIERNYILLYDFKIKLKDYQLRNNTRKNKIDDNKSDIDGILGLLDNYLEQIMTYLSYIRTKKKEMYDKKSSSQLKLYIIIVIISVVSFITEILRGFGIIK